jgi:hypothetical protein
MFGKQAVCINNPYTKAIIKLKKVSLSFKYNSKQNTLIRTIYDERGVVPASYLNIYFWESDKATKTLPIKSHSRVNIGFKKPAQMGTYFVKDLNVSFTFILLAKIG